jgi:hypothetical protein
VALFRYNPIARSIEASIEASGGDDGMYVGVKHEVLSPGMQNHRCTCVRAQALFILRKSLECLPCRAKNEAVAEARIIATKIVELGRDGKYDGISFNSGEA